MHCIRIIQQYKCYRKENILYLVLRPTTYARVIQSREILLPQLYQQQKNTNANEEQYSAAWPFSSHTKTFREKAEAPTPQHFQHCGTKRSRVISIRGLLTLGWLCWGPAIAPFTSRRW